MRRSGKLRYGSRLRFPSTLLSRCGLHRPSSKHPISAMLLSRVRISLCLCSLPDSSSLHTSPTSSTFSKSTSLAPRPRHSRCRWRRLPRSSRACHLWSPNSHRARRRHVRHAHTASPVSPAILVSLVFFVDSTARPRTDSIPQYSYLRFSLLSLVISLSCPKLHCAAMLKSRTQSFLGLFSVLISTSSTTRIHDHPGWDVIPTSGRHHAFYPQSFFFHLI
ncbi:hypothetical protein B0H14DRAFT_1484161 [Mycena olivaceomarginata]|nr:hypothetical protein B0H14DRAFT_1484161 [Mycena olivaceomarginata]